MSQMEHNKGVLRPVTNEEIEALNIDVPDYYTDLEEYLRCNPEFGIHFIDGKPYKADLEISSAELYEIKRAEVKENGDIHFETYHYNGGGHWTEVVESALRGGNL